ncbi:MAG: AraC family transcriptional regulator [Amphritea sp.]
MANPEYESLNLNEVTLPTQVLALIADVVKDKGVSEFDLLEGSGLLPRDLRQSGSFLKYHQVLTIINNALRLYPEPGLGLEVGKREKISTWGLLGFAMMSAETLGDALVIAQRYYPAGPALVDMEFLYDEASCHTRAYTPYPVGHALPFVVEELGSCMASVFGVMLGQPFKFSEIQLSYDQPAYANKYREIFACPISWNCPVNQFSFDISFLQMPLVTTDPVSMGVAEKLCQEALVKQGVETDITHEIRRILMRNPGRFPSMELVGEELQISTRSLRRHLADLDTSFQAILDDVRMNLAIQYLGTAKLPLEEIAVLVGFNEYNNFRKAFKRWTGHPPSFYRTDD